MDVALSRPIKFISSIGKTFLNIKPVLITCFLFTSMNVQVPAHAAEENAALVEISSTRDPELKSYRQMYKGLEAFDQKRQLAPDAILKFKLLPVSADISLHDLSMRIASDDDSVHVEVEPDGSFILPKNPRALQENADLLLNRKKGLFRWRPDIRSAGVPTDQRRLGDLRLECEIWWAVENDSMPYETRNLFRLLGGACQSSIIDISYWSPKKLSAAYLVSKDRREKIQISQDGLQFIPPLYKKDWADASLIEFEFAASSEK
ncbi:hypothetical protein [Undibacterium pigrum]|uniref:hypothetical protein n=1 Tax=Undibacterium pigrum TaxID=401470 RepID=UPI0011B4286E|nr:hypothetical protein [Undibacterium pigrum]